MTTSNLPVLLFLVPFTSALLTLILGWTVRGTARYAAVAALGATAALAWVALGEVHQVGPLRSTLGGWAPPLGIEVALDPLGAFVSAVIATVAFLVVLGGAPLARVELAGREAIYYPLVLLLTSGLMGMLAAADLFNLFVHLEVTSLSGYALVAAGGRGAPRAGMHYLLIGSVGATLYLLGVGFLYAATGSLNMADVGARLSDGDPRLALVAGVLVVVGLGIKAAYFPLHVWMPSAYGRAPAVAAAVMAPLVTKVSAFAIFRVLYWVLGDGTRAVEPVLLELLAWSGAGAMVFGGVMALAQSDLRRLLAYSSVSQMGIVAMGAALVSDQGLGGSVMHIANDALMKGVLFLAAALVFVRFGVQTVADLSALRGRAPLVSAAMVIGILSLVGIPPLAGFFGKWYVLRAAVEADRFGLVAALVLGSLATVGYAVRLIEALYFSPKVERRVEGPSPLLPGLGIGLLCAGILVVGLANAYVWNDLILPGLPLARP